MHIPENLRMRVEENRAQTQDRTIGLQQNCVPDCSYYNQTEGCASKIFKCIAGSLGWALNRYM